LQLWIWQDRMQVTLEIPDDVASVLQAQGLDLSRAALEAVGIEAFRLHRITAHQLRRPLGFGARYELDGFLKRHEVWLDYSPGDLDADRETAERLWQERQAEVAREAARERRAG
jgi:hypothetical protein